LDIKYETDFKHLISYNIYNTVSSTPWNSPYLGEEIEQKSLFTSFSSPPRHLDPVVSYSSNEWSIISQIYEPPLQYNYIARPYRVEPLTLKSMPEIIYIDENGSRVDKNSTNISYTDYIFRLRDDILYQNHPAFLRENWNLKDDIDSIYNLKLSTRRLMASDYIYAIKRMALRDNSSPYWILWTTIYWLETAIL